MFAGGNSAAQGHCHYSLVVAGAPILPGSRLGPARAFCSAHIAKAAHDACF